MVAATSAATVISLFAVPPDADEAFIAAWAPGSGTLHRALRSDADFRYVEVAPADGESSRDTYAVAHEDGDPDGAGGVLVIDAFEVPPEADEPFLAAWGPSRAVFARHRGYLGSRLHRSAGPADFRFVAIARWSSPLMFARAVRDPEAVEVPFAAHRALYQPVR